MRRPMLSWLWVLVLVAIWVWCTLAFDRVVRWQHTHARRDWELDGRPIGMLRRVPESGSVPAAQSAMLRWLFRTPVWVVDDAEAARLLRSYRTRWVVWTLGVLVLG